MWQVEITQLIVMHYLKLLVESRYYTECLVSGTRYFCACPDTGHASRTYNRYKE